MPKVAAAVLLTLVAVGMMAGCRKSAPVLPPVAAKPVAGGDGAAAPPPGALGAPPSPMRAGDPTPRPGYLPDRR